MVHSRDGVLEDCPRPRGQLEDKNVRPWPWPWPRSPLALALALNLLALALALRISGDNYFWYWYHSQRCHTEVFGADGRIGIFTSNQQPMV